MPGTIQVSVMDFQGLPSTSTPPTFLKVSLGKKEYQTSDRGDFSFPLTTFRDNLVVKLLDAEGNQIAHTGIQTMLIVQKVSWDEIFPLDGGGYVHLKLQFILNEEERTRIRLKREAAVKKKQGNIPNVSEKYSEIATSVGSSFTSSLQAEREVSDSQTRTVLSVASLRNVPMAPSLLPNPDIVPTDRPPNYAREEGNILTQKIPKSEEEKERVFSAPTIQGTEVLFPKANQIADVKKLETESSLPNVSSNPISGKEDSSKLVYSGSVVAESSSSISLGQEDVDVDKSEQRVQPERSPSQVRNLVTAFESSLAKDSKSSGEASDVRSETKKVGKRGQQYESAKQSSGRLVNPFGAEGSKSTLKISTKRGEDNESARSFVDNMSNEEARISKNSTAAPIRLVGNELSSMEWAESPAQPERSSSAEEVTISGRMHTDHSERVYSFRLSAEKRYSGGTLFAEGKGRGRTDSTKIDIQVASIEKSKSLEYYEEEHFYSENSRMWIFPNNTKYLCLTAAGKRVMNLLGSDPSETKSHQNKNSSSSSGEVEKQSTAHGSEHEMRKNQKGSQSTRNSRLESSPDDPSCGVFGQVIKIAIIVGFGALVLLTRQREPRKSKRDTRELLFTTSGYMDEQENNEEQGGYNST